MKVNMGSFDRRIRAIAGTVLTVLGLFYHSWVLLIGLILLLTAWSAFCPVYRIFGWSTEKYGGPTQKPHPQ